jgi:hypothetical protein
VTIPRATSIAGTARSSCSTTTGTEVVRWPVLNAEGNEVAIETVEIAHEGLERA